MSHVCSKKFKTKKMFATRRMLPCQFIEIFFSLNFSIPYRNTGEKRYFPLVNVAQFSHSDIIAREACRACMYAYCTVKILYRI